MNQSNATIDPHQEIAPSEAFPQTRGAFGVCGASGGIAGLYVHIPFCFHKCHYCDFYSLVDQPDQNRQPVFVDALIRQLQALPADFFPQTLFIGGGTPTLLAPDLWRRLLDTIRQRGLLDEACEFTVEANPETVTDELAQILASGGVNRVSIGAQSFNNKLLKQLERWHDPANVLRAKQCFEAAGIDNINVDMMFAIPTQTLDELDGDIDRVIELNPQHLSYYSLIFEPNTPLTQKLKLGRVSGVGETVEREMYERVIARLRGAGYEHYEISNWSKPGKQCQHNLVYWRNENWLAVGPSASGHVAGRRWKIEPRLSAYIEQSPTPKLVDEELLAPKAQVGEHLMMTLRLREGVALNWLADRLSEDDPRQQQIAEFIERGLLERTATHLRLTHEGLFLADAIAARLL